MQRRERTLNETAAYLSTQLEPIIRAALDASTRTCVNCYHFDILGEVCTKASPPLRPPAYVIVAACAQWEEDIPF